MKHCSIHTRRGQGGFIQGAILLGLVILALVVGAFALSNRGSATKSDLETAKVMAATVIKRGNDLRDAAFRLAQDRDLANMRLVNGVVPAAPALTAGQFDLFSTTFGVASEVLLPAKATTGSADVAMTYDQTFTIGADTNQKVFVLEDVNDATCRMINKTIYGDSVDTAPVAAASFPAGREEGCVDVGSGVFAYFKKVG